MTEQPHTINSELNADVFSVTYRELLQLRRVLGSMPYSAMAATSVGNIDSVETLLAFLENLKSSLLWASENNHEKEKELLEYQQLMAAGQKLFKMLSVDLKPVSSGGHQCVCGHVTEGAGALEDHFAWANEFDRAENHKKRS